LTTTTTTKVRSGGGSLISLRIVIIASTVLRKATQERTSAGCRDATQTAKANNNIETFKTDSVSSATATDAAAAAGSGLGGAEEELAPDLLRHQLFPAVLGGEGEGGDRDGDVDELDRERLVRAFSRLPVGTEQDGTVVVLGGEDDYDEDDERERSATSAAGPDGTASAAGEEEAIPDPLRVDDGTASDDEAAAFTDDELFAVLNGLNSSSELLVVEEDGDRDEGRFESEEEESGRAASEPLLPPLRSSEDLNGNVVDDDHGYCLADDPYGNGLDELPEIAVLDVVDGGGGSRQQGGNLQEEGGYRDAVDSISREDLDLVFEDASTEGSDQQQEQQSIGEGSDEEAEPRLEEDTPVLELLDQLGDLTLNFGDGDGQDGFDGEGFGDGDGLEGFAVDNYPDDPDYVHPSWYCQPCSPSALSDSNGHGDGQYGVASPLRSIAEDQEFDGNDVDRSGASAYWNNDHIANSNDLAASLFQLQRHKGLTLPASALGALPVTDQEIDELLRFSSLSLEHSRIDMSEELANAVKADDEEAVAAAARASATDDDDDDDQQQTDPRLHVEAVDPSTIQAAKLVLDTFAAKLFSSDKETKEEDEEDGNEKKKKKKIIHSKERLCLGHRERILGVDISPCGRFVASASQDSSVRIWNAATNTLVRTMSNARQGTSEYECLRVAWASPKWGQGRIPRNNEYAYLLATGNANGEVHLYSCSDPATAAFVLIATLDHASFSHFRPGQDGQGNVDPDDKPQVYALQFVDHWNALPSGGDQEDNSFLLTSSDDHIHLWEINPDVERKKVEEIDAKLAADTKHFSLQEVMSLRFGDMHHSGYGVTICQVTGDGMKVPSLPQGPNSQDPVAPSAGGYTFGGDRNPQNLVYVFDAGYCSANGLLGAALSDGSLRLLNGRGVCLTLLHLPGVQSHLTSFAWDASGKRLATTVATGQLITWEVEYDNNADSSSGSAARLHLLGQTSIKTSCRAVYQGVHDIGRPLFGAAFVDDDDDFLVSWGVDGRIVLWDGRARNEVYAPLSVLLYKADYPIYTVCWRRPSRKDGQVIAVGGGGTDGGFVGIPLYLYDCYRDAEDDKKQGSASKDQLAKEMDDTSAK